jgi:hypothetical protein
MPTACSLARAARLKPSSDDEHVLPACQKCHDVIEVRNDLGGDDRLNVIHLRRMSLLLLDGRQRPTRPPSRLWELVLSDVAR